MLAPKGARVTTGAAINGYLRRALAILAMVCVATGHVLGGETGQMAAASAVVQRLHDALGAVSAEADRLDLEARYAALEPVVAETHDLEFTARFTIRRAWDELSEEQRSAFLDEFTRLSVLTYASRFARLATDALSIGDSRDSEGGRIEVHATLRTPDERSLPMIYILQRQRNGWRIINIVVDGVSDLALRRAEYSRLLREEDFDSLLREIRAQSAELTRQG